jgi:hypothetical protein
MGLRVLRVHTAEPWLVETDATFDRFKMVVESRNLIDIKGSPVAISYQCPSCSLLILEANSSLPDWVISELDEILLCFKVGAYTSMTIMSRRLIDRLAAEYGGKGHTLESKLLDLSTRANFAGASLFWMGRMRELGNFAAHGSGIKWQDERNASIVGLSLALAQALFLEAPKESEYEGLWVSSWEDDE